jgi:hypothetical protein
MHILFPLLTAKLKLFGEGKMRPASSVDLQRAIDANFPDVLINFYRTHEPDPRFECIELQQRIWSITHALRENLDGIPGIGLFPHGYVVFASTLCGDSYCIDTTTPTPCENFPVVLFSHEVVDETTTLGEIQKYRVVVASSFHDFLRQFLIGSLSEEAKYC